MPRGSPFRSKKFRNLYKYPKRSRFWIYRRHSPEIDKDFDFSTGEETNERAAHKIGEEAYYKWLEQKSQAVQQERDVYFKDFAQAHLDRKLARPLSDFSKNSRNTSSNAARHLIEAFGHLRISQVNEDRWEDYVNRLSEGGEPPKFFNRRKELREIMARAYRNGLIERVPEYRDPDPDTSAGRALAEWEVQLILWAASSDFALFLELLWRQGPRPREEALKYEWEMIHWREGTLTVPSRITKTRRSRTIPMHPVILEKLRGRHKAATSRFLWPSPEHMKGGEHPLRDYRAAWEGSLARAQAKALELGLELQPCVVYDFRRTFLTNCAEQGKDIFWAAKYTDTSVKMVERFYAKVRAHAMRGIVT